MVGRIEVEHLHPIELLGHTLFAIVLVIEPDVWDGRKYAVMCVRRSIDGITRLAKSANLLINGHPIAKADRNLLECCDVM